MLLERDGERLQLARALDTAAAGAGRLVIIEGPAGIGKTALLHAAGLLAADRGFQVLTARAGVLEQPLGYGVAGQLFETLILRADSDLRRKLLHGPASLATQVLAVEARDVAFPPLESEFQAQHALHWLVANLADAAPVLLSVDDAHWADEATLRWLVYLVRRLEGVPVVVMLTVRSDDPRAPHDLLDALAVDPAGEVLVPCSLSEAATVQLLEGSYGVPVETEFGHAFYGWTGGNPFLASELAAELLAQHVDPVGAAVDRMRQLSPEAVSRSTLLRLGRLSSEAAALARAACIFEAHAELRHAAVLAGLDPDAANQAADTLAQSRILEPGHQLRFMHPLIRSVIYEDLPPARRAADHGRAAKLLANDGVSAEHVSVQVLHSAPGADPWAVAQLRTAATDQLARAAPEAAARLLRRALDEPPPATERSAVLGELGMAEDLAGDSTGIGHLREAVTQAQADDQRAQAVLRLSMPLLRLGRFEEAAGFLRQELDHSSGTRGSALDLALEVNLCVALLFADGRSCMEADRRLEHLAPRLTASDPADRLALAALALRRVMRGQPYGDAIAASRRSLEAGLIDDRDASGGPAGNALGALIYSDALDEADRWLLKLLGWARRSGSQFGLAMISFLQGLSAYRRGAIADAAAEAELSAIATDDYGRKWGDTLSVALLIDARVERGDATLVEAELVKRGLDGDVPDGPLFAVLLESRGRWRQAQGDPAGALRDFTGAADRFTEWGTVGPGYTAWRSRSALAHLQLGDRRSALRLAREEVELAHGFGAPRSLGVALRVEGIVEGGPLGLELLTRSQQVLSESPARLEHAHSLVQLGAAARRANQRRRAVALLKEGLDLAHDCGAVPLIEYTLDELRAAGTRPRTLVRRGIDALTASELRISRMASSGMSNPEIAQTLLVTRATVESHLHSAYRKLDVQSRKELREVLGTAPNGEDKIS